MKIITVIRDFDMYKRLLRMENLSVLTRIVKKIVRLGRRVKTGIKVQTFDCQCLIIHSSLINRYKLRFDENLTFDLYVEDFCANANEKL